MKIQKLNTEQQEFFDYFYTDYETDLKQEFLKLADRENENVEGGILEGEDFKEYCLQEFNDYVEHLKTKHNDDRGEID